MQFYNKTSFRDVRLTMYFYFLESLESGILSSKEPSECDSLICCINKGKTVKQYCH
jgi:hypothetical protein